MTYQTRKPHPKTKFTPEEDEKLKELVANHGENNWYLISELMPGRNTRQCRERWRYYLSPEVSNAPWTEEEDNLLDEKYRQFGPKWKLIAKFFPKRTDINVKSRWHVHRRREAKKMKKMMENKKERKRKTVKQVPQNITPVVDKQNQQQDYDDFSNYFMQHVEEEKSFEDFSGSSALGCDFAPYFDYFW
ncbi:Myb-like DNA-binding domain containing protein [Histomonas meleagridis]|uniref:Myb-like DNA-binding domain containing protein n=1 Tax=Histomonas meleagridis TaxID=135588 RepID=UPI00355A35EE|nr:Myb-like DNA-binding domain containing protein [Histomonas meleagridis]KAH0806196.1 Myb-like DNA-binding domain containing protein [Histomonas meleagridis]